MMTLEHATQPLPPVDVVRAAAAMGGPLWAWSAPSRGEWWAAFGVLESHEDVDAALVDSLSLVTLAGPDAPPGPWFGSVAFDARRCWSGWPAARFILPKGIFWVRDGRCHASALGSGSAAADLLRAMVDVAGRSGDRPAATRASISWNDGDPAQKAHWTALVEQALAQVAAGRLRKVVPARAIHGDVTGTVDPVELMQRLHASYPGCQAFLWTGKDGSLFAGATPETLCRVTGRDVVVDALAGTAPPNQADALLRAVKEGLEHRLVVEAVVGGLDGLATHVKHAPSPSLMRLPNLVHLHTPIHATLKPGVGAGAVVAALHPTPAVAGTPRQDAMEFLATQEGFARGAYAGPIGLTGQGSAHFCVALRCAHIRPGSVDLFVGAGVVAGSVPELEWQETARKARPMRDAVEEAIRAAS